MKPHTPKSEQPTSVRFRKACCAVLSAGLLCPLLLAGETAVEANADPSKPSFVILFADDIGWGDVHFRRDKLEWPNVERLMREGVTFSDAYAASPTCSPSRAALLTGQSPARFHLVRHIEESRDGRHPEFSQYPGDPAHMASRNWLPLEETTLAAALKPLGYRTAFVGKWHLGHEPFYPVHHGFDEQYGVTDFGHPQSFTAPFWKDCATYQDAPAGKYLDDLLTDDAVRFLERQRPGQPFLLTVFYYGAHTPAQGRKDWVEHFQKKGLVGDAAQQAAQCAVVDESVGRIREALERLGLAGQTIVVFSGDQGGLMPNTPLRGGKPAGVALYEGGARVPLVFCGPEVVRPGRISAEPVVTTDVFPTLLELAGGSQASYPKLDGNSLVCLLKAKTETLGREAVFLYRSYDDQYAAVRAGEWKLIAYRSGKSELFKLSTDPSESDDRAARDPEKTAALRTQLAAWEKRMGVALSDAEDKSGADPKAKE